jgi:hypothetical protein
MSITFGIGQGYSQPPANAYTGWGDYADTQYTEVSPWQPTTGIWEDVPNNALSAIEVQKPLDISTFYDPITSTILGRNGDGLSLTVEFIAKPTTSSTTFLDVAFFIGGSLGPLEDGRIYPRLMSFPKGQGEARPLSFNVDGFTSGTWEANGAKVQMKTNAAIDIYKIRYVLTREHKAR